MYSLVHSKSRNRLRMEKAEALIYIYTNSWLLCKKPSAYPIYYYDDNNFSKDFNDYVGVFSNANNDNNNDNGSKDHNDNNGNTSDEEEEHPRGYSPINL